MQRRSNTKIVIANWKMNPETYREADGLVRGIYKGLQNIKKTEVVLCMPFVWLTDFSHKKYGNLKFGAQNAFWTEKGAYTGEVSPTMLKGAGVKYVILGHSERRTMGEGNDLINKKIKSALASGLVPIICVGESVRDENHEYFNVVKTQLIECLNGVLKDYVSKIIVAYEPVWSISTTPNRRDATPEDFLEMSIFIKKVLSDKFGAKTKMPRIIYGGSVNNKNIGDFVKHESVDGVLVGNASLEAKKFSEILKICEASGK